MPTEPELSTPRRVAIPGRAMLAALALLLALGAVLLIHLAIGLGDVLLYGLVGGIVGSLIVIALDLLRNAQRAIERTLPEPREAETSGENKR